MPGTLPDRNANLPYHKHSRKHRKKIRGELHYFSGDPEKARKEYWDLLDQLEQSAQPEVKPQPKPRAKTSVASITTKYLLTQRERCENGEITERTVYDVDRVCTLLDANLGDSDANKLEPEDFASLKRVIYGRFNTPAGRGNIINGVRQVFRWAVDCRILQTTPHYGPDFRAPKKKAFREHQKTLGRRHFKREEILKSLEKANPYQKAFILLGINCGFYSSDCAGLTFQMLEEIEESGGFLDYMREKTATDRLVYLWPETREALVEYVASRPRTASRQFVFVAPKTLKPYYGLDYAHSDINYHLKRVLPMPPKYLRHTFATVADELELKDSVISLILGHTPRTIRAAHYSAPASKARVKKASLAVRDWLFN